AKPTLAATTMTIQTVESTSTAPIRAVEAEPVTQVAPVERSQSIEVAAPTPETGPESAPTTVEQAPHEDAPAQPESQTAAAASGVGFVGAIWGFFGWLFSYIL